MKCVQVMYDNSGKTWLADINLVNVTSWDETKEIEETLCRRYGLCKNCKWSITKRYN